MPEFVAPEYGKAAFNCPHCSVFSRQTFFDTLRAANSGTYSGGIANLKNVSASQCDHCERIALWYDEQLVFPAVSPAPEAHSDMPEDVKADYSEAREVVNRSARAAAALLRLSLQKLMIHLGEKGENINDDIGHLVARGLDANLQRALDVVRITGNNAVHPGELDIRDDVEIVTALFRFINLVVQQMISQPREVSALWERMPEAARKGVARRDER